MLVVEIALTILAVIVLLPVTVLFIQVLASLPAARQGAALCGPRPRVAVIMPAHNEALVIAATVRDLLPQLTAGDRLIVVADNCNDDTAAIAAAAGAEVIERHDMDRRGKGYALDFGVRALNIDPPDVVAIVDADCQVAIGTLERLARTAVFSRRPVQALYLMHAPAGSGIKTRIAAFAWVVKNQVRATGYHWLGLPCQLMGTGMAFPWVMLHSANLASGHIVEDLKLGIDLARAGTPALFSPEALVTSTFPESAAGVQTQRTRWEHGHLGVMIREAPWLLLAALRSRNGALLALALDLCVPPLALLALIVGSLFATAVLAFIVFGAYLPLVPAGVAVTMLVISVFFAWVAYGRMVVGLADLVLAPVYVLWKIPVYLKFLVARQAEWVRSKRD